MKLYNKDCLDVLKEMPEKCIDLIVTDCPYHIVRGGCSNKVKNSGILSKSSASNGKLFEYNDIDFKDWLPEVYRVLKDGTHCYIMVNSRNIKELQQEAENAGFIFQNILVWIKNNKTMNRYYMGQCEFILMLRKGPARTINIPGTSNCLFYDNIVGKRHPTEKPYKLMQVMIENSSNEGDIVLDPFMGAGSTGIACKYLNRKFIGIEIDKKYYDIAREGLNA